MATITVTLKGSASGLINESVNDQVFAITLPEVTAAQVEADAASLHLPGENPATGIVLSASEAKTFWIEKVGATVEVSVKD